MEMPRIKRNPKKVALAQAILEMVLCQEKVPVK